MFTEYTYQDFAKARATGNVSTVLRDIVKKYKASDDFARALEADKYFEADETKVSKKVILKANAVETKTEDGRKKTLVKRAVCGNQIRSSFFSRFVIQQNQFLLGHGVTLDNEETKKRLGVGFDKSLERIGEKALLHGVCWGYWNKDHIEVIPACSGELSGFVALLDERTSQPRVGVQFWQLNNSRPMYVRLFEEDGVSEYESADKGELVISAEKRAYLQTVSISPTGEREIVGGENYSSLPIVPFFASELKKSELTPAIKTKIDLYDIISSDFGDNLEQANDVYWVLNNFGGTSTEVLETIQKINELKAVVNVSDGAGNNSTAVPHAFEVPYEARRIALELLEKALYSDYMALNVNELTGGSLTNVAIQAAMTNINLKADRYEWQAFSFVQGVLRLIGVETEEITFKRQTIANRSEIVQDIATMREDIDQETALKLNPYIMQEEIEQIIRNTAAQQFSGLPSVGELEKTVEE